MALYYVKLCGKTRLPRTSLSLSKPDPPGGGSEAGPGSGGLGAYCTEKETGARPLALTATSCGAALAAPTVRLPPHSPTVPTQRRFACPGQRRGIHRATLCPGKPQYCDVSLCQVHHASPASLLASLCGVPPSLPGSSVLPQPRQGTDLTGRPSPVHPTQMAVPPTKHGRSYLILHLP